MIFQRPCVTDTGAAPCPPTGRRGRFPRPRSCSGPGGAALCALLVGWISPGGLLSADVIRLQNGGEVRGELLEDPADEEGPVTVRTLSGAVVSVAREEIEFLKRRSPLIEEYVSRARRAANTVEARWELAEWCRTHLLAPQREEQLEALLDLDPEHKEARRILGYVQHNGQWLTREELMTSRGYVRHKGKWITTQELDLIEKTQAQRNAEVVWYPKVRLWLAWVTGNNGNRRGEGLKNFEQLADADAIPALTTAMAEHDERDVRLLYVRVLGGIRGPRPVKALLDRYLLDANQNVRQEALAGLQPAQHEAAVPYLVSSLGHDSNTVIRRAAAALSSLGDSRAVPGLINALVTTHKYKVQVRSNSGMSFGTSPNGRPGMVDPNVLAGLLPPEIAVLARTGQLPYGAVVLQHPATPQRTRVVTLKVDIKNEEVLNALLALTGRNFGYNQRDWQLWWAVQEG